jgi:hypothetical protein
MKSTVSRTLRGVHGLARARAPAPRAPAAAGDTAILAGNGRGGGKITVQILFARGAPGAVLRFALCARTPPASERVSAAACADTAACARAQYCYRLAGGPRKALVAAQVRKTPGCL